MNRNKVGPAVAAFAATLVIVSAVTAGAAVAFSGRDGSASPLTPVPVDGPSPVSVPEPAPYPGPTPGRVAPELTPEPRNPEKHVMMFWGRKNVCLETTTDIRAGWRLAAEVAQWNQAQDRVRLNLRASCDGAGQKVRIRQYWDASADRDGAVTTPTGGEWVWRDELGGHWYWKVTRVELKLNMFYWGRSWNNNGVETPWECQAPSILAHELGHVIGLPHLDWVGTPSVVLGKWYDQNRFCGGVLPINHYAVDEVYELTRG